MKYKITILFGVSDDGEAKDALQIIRQTIESIKSVEISSTYLEKSNLMRQESWHTVKNSKASFLLRGGASLLREKGETK